MAKAIMWLLQRHYISNYQMKTMSIYHNERSKIYPELNPTAPLKQEVYPYNWRLVKVRAVKAYLKTKLLK